MLAYADVCWHISSTCCVRAFSVSVSQCSTHLHARQFFFRSAVSSPIALASSTRCSCVRSRATLQLSKPSLLVLHWSVCAYWCVSVCLRLTGLHACMSGSCMNPKVNDDLIALVVRGMCELEGCQHHLDVAHCNEYDTFWPHVLIDTNICTDD